MAAIVLQFSTERSVGSWMIREYEHGWASHVDTVLPDGRLLGARLNGGVQIRLPGYAPFLRTEVVSIPCSDAVAQAYYAAVESQVGAPYDIEAIIAFALGRDWHRQGAWICSELVAWGLETAGVFGDHVLSSPANSVNVEMLRFLVSSVADHTPNGGGPKECAISPCLLAPSSPAFFSQAQ